MKRQTIHMKCQVLFSLKHKNFKAISTAVVISASRVNLFKITQEAHGPRFAQVSDIATADMQILCNIFPILKKLMKISSFEQFLVLKKNIWA